MPCGCWGFVCLCWCMETWTEVILSPRVKLNSSFRRARWESFALFQSIGYHIKVIELVELVTNWSWWEPLKSPQQDVSAAVTAVWSGNLGFSSFIHHDQYPDTAEDCHVPLGGTFEGHCHECGPVWTGQNVCLRIRSVLQELKCRSTSRKQNLRHLIRNTEQPSHQNRRWHRTLC